MLKRIGRGFHAYWRWTTGGSVRRLVAGFATPVVLLIALAIAGDDETREWLADSPKDNTFAPADPSLDEAWEEAKV